MMKCYFGVECTVSVEMYLSRGGGLNCREITGFRFFATAVMAAAVQYRHR